MLKKSHDDVADFRRFLANAIEEIEGLERAPFLLSGEPYLRRCAAIVSEAGLQALHAGFADLHERSQAGEFAERATALTFLADCVARCREVETEQPGAGSSQKIGMMTADEVAEFLGITTRSVRRRVLDGTLPKPVKIGRSVRFPRKDIEAVAAGK
jgi:excisionase family DNA binding protein